MLFSISVNFDLSLYSANAETERHQGSEQGMRGIKLRWQHFRITNTMTLYARRRRDSTWPSWIWVVCWEINMMSIKSGMGLSSFSSAVPPECVFANLCDYFLSHWMIAGVVMMIKLFGQRHVYSIAVHHWTEISILRPFILVCKPNCCCSGPFTCVPLLAPQSHIRWKKYKIFN